MRNESILQVENLSVSFPTENGVLHAVKSLSYEVYKGETFAIVGESGSGKSVSSLAVMGLLPKYARISGSIHFDGLDMLSKSDLELSKIRGKDISIIFQDPLSALTPVYRVGQQITEAILAHSKVTKRAAHKRAIELLDAVGIPDPNSRVMAFPHELSGGQRQRVCIAMAIANNPKLIIADEPTTALDPTIQAQILELLHTAVKETSAAIVLITHDLGLVSGWADRVMIMLRGEYIESGQVREIFTNPQSTYTKELIECIPTIGKTQTRLKTIQNTNLSLEGQSAFRARTDEGLKAKDSSAPTPVLVVKNLSKLYPITKGKVIKKKIGALRAVDSISFHINKAETFAIIGESGCGKTSTIMQIMQLIKPQSGSIFVDGKDISQLTSAQRKKMRSFCSIVFQDPMASLDPRMPVSDILAEPMQVHGWDKTKIQKRISFLLDAVGLAKDHTTRYPQEFSGGQRQRIGIARALACNPNLIVLDEPLSALDVSIQAGIINLLQDLKKDLALSYLFISHDLSVVGYLADRVAVMYLGNIVELGEAKDIFINGFNHPYTTALISAIPNIDSFASARHRRIILKGDIPTVSTLSSHKSGCKFASRCWLWQNALSKEEQNICTTKTPVMTLSRDISKECASNCSKEHKIMCHFTQKAYDHLSKLKEKGTHE